MKKFILKILSISTFFLFSLPGHATESTGSAAIESANSEKHAEFFVPIALLAAFSIATLLITKNHHSSDESSGNTAH